MMFSTNQGTPQDYSSLHQIKAVAHMTPDGETQTSKNKHPVAKDYGWPEMASWFTFFWKQTNSFLLILKWRFLTMFFQLQIPFSNMTKIESEWILEGTPPWSRTKRFGKNNDLQPFWVPSGDFLGEGLRFWIQYVPWPKVAILGMVIPPSIGKPYNGYINPSIRLMTIPTIGRQWDFRPQHIIWEWEMQVAFCQLEHYIILSPLKITLATLYCYLKNV